MLIQVQSLLTWLIVHSDMLLLIRSETPLLLIIPSLKLLVTL